MHSTYETLIDRIVAERERAGLTQAELAKCAGLTQSAVARLERKKAIPQLNTLYRVLEPLGCTLAVVHESADP